MFISHFPEHIFVVLGTYCKMHINVSILQLIVSETRWGQQGDFHAKSKNLFLFAISLTVPGG